MLVSLGCQAGGLAQYSPMSGITPRIPPLGWSISPHPQRDGQVHLRRHLRVERHCFRLCRPQEPRWLGRSSSDRERLSYCDSVSYTPPISGKRAAVWGVSQGLRPPSCCRRPSSIFRPPILCRLLLVPAGQGSGLGNQWRPGQAFVRLVAVARTLLPGFFHRFISTQSKVLRDFIFQKESQVASFKCQAAIAKRRARTPDFPHTPLFQYSIIPPSQLRRRTGQCQALHGPAQAFSMLGNTGVAENTWVP